MEIVSLAISNKKGNRKKTVDEVVVVANYGIRGDAHAGPWHRQVSLLASESIDKARAMGLDVGYGDFAENIATKGIHWPSVGVGSRWRLGESVVIEITQIGKECHKPCAIYYTSGDCIMPREGVFARVLKGGKIRCGDKVVEVLRDMPEKEGGHEDKREDQD